MNDDLATELIWAGDPSSVELRAVLACARAVVNPECLKSFWTALAACDDVDRLCKTAVAHGMLGHLHQMVTAGLALYETTELPTHRAATTDPALVRRLSELQRAATERSLRQTGHLLRLLTLLNKAGIDAMPYKGPAGAQRLYGDVTRRTWADLDILVRHEQIARAREALLSNGYADGNEFNARILRRERRGWGEVAFSLSSGGVHVELHWEVTVGFSGRPLLAGPLLARAGRLELLGREVLCPSAGDLLLITCVNGTKDRWDSVEALLGLAVQVRDTAPADWRGVVTAARAAGCFRRVIVAVAHACQVLSLETPPEVIEAIAADGRARSLLRSLTAASLDQGSEQEHRRQLATLHWRFATEDTAVSGLLQAGVRLLRPGPEDWSAVSLAPRAAWLYYLLRPFRLAVKWAKRL